jgi:hypothetical protein
LGKTASRFMHLLLKEPVHSRAIAGLDGDARPASGGGPAEAKPLKDEAAPVKVGAMMPAEPASPVAP